ncbi:hypothetical protein [Roseateles sp.]|uniref:hypothetical protein n=1 Tax=Roseateles sp. TaxID=1971397 RepID=UPI003263148A
MAPTRITHGIRFEVAQDVLGAVLAHLAEAAAQALDAANPDPGHLTEIEAEQRKFRTLRHDLDPRDVVQIESVIAEHAPLARRLYAAA